ncbi:MAG: mechanosensitive ion channel family protein [Oscillospiraceae bacterium]|nr:mechanosensitive ion channel family protein [Oscillospiraceae bacterium]
MRDFLEFFSENAADILENKLVQAAITVLAAFLLTRLTKFIIRHSIERSENMTGRIETLFRVFGKCINAVIYFFAVLQICQVVFNIQPTSLIAATGVVSVALGFGAQSIVKDVISGFLIIFENQFSVGDLVTIDGFNGRIHEITLRTTLVKNIYGDILTIPNGSVSKVINHSREMRCVLIDVSISYEDDIDNAVEVLSEVCAEAEDIDYITERPKVPGVIKLDESGVVIRISVMCEIDRQFETEREMLRRIKYAFDNNNISIPYNHIMLVNKEIGTSD